MKDMFLGICNMLSRHTFELHNHYHLFPNHTDIFGIYSVYMPHHGFCIVR